MSGGWQGRKVLVAGAGSGIGKAIAGAFAVAGASTFLGGRDGAKLAAAASAMEGDVTALPGDYAGAQIPELLAKTGALDVLVVCYGDTDTPPGFDTSDEVWDRLMTANLGGPAKLARAAALAMKARGRGAILFIGSICGREVLGAPIAYNVGKAGLRALTKTMSRELGPSGVRVNMISPGNILFEGGRWADKRAAAPERIAEMLEATVPLRRFGTPEEIAEAALFLCSDRAGFVTGVDLAVDGGQTTAF